MLDSLPLGAARQQRPAKIVRYTFEDFEAASRGQIARVMRSGPIPIVPIEAVASGDQQVIAAREPSRFGEPVIDLGALADFPSVESVVASTRIECSRETPNVCELLLTYGTPAPDVASLRRFPALSALHMRWGAGEYRLDLEGIAAEPIRKLALNRWFVKDLAPLHRMNGVRQLHLELFKDSLEAVAGMPELEYLHVRGPAKGWALLRNCAKLAEAHFIDVQMANLRRWNTWKQLRKMTLSGRGVKSLAGLQASENLESLTLLNLNMSDLSYLRELPRLKSLELRMADRVDLESAASIPGLRSFVIDSSRRDGAFVQLTNLQPLRRASGLEELVLLETVIEDGDLLPLADLAMLKKVRLGSMIGADVEKLRIARPDLQIQYRPPDTRFDALKERVGRITIQKPGAGLEQWSIFEDLASLLGVTTNYAAETRIRREVRKRNPELARRLEWDTEAGAVGCYGNNEADIRIVAEIVNQLAAD